MNFEFNAVSSFFLIRKLRKAPDDVTDAIEERMGSIVQGLVRYIQEQKLSGQVLKVKTGALKDSIRGSFRRSLWHITVEVGTGSLPYAEILEDGGTTGPHIIRAVRAKVLRWISRSGEIRYAKQVQHPGSKIPSFNYMKSSLEDQAPTIKEQILGAVNRGLAKDLPK